MSIKEAAPLSPGPESLAVPSGRSFNSGTNLLQHLREEMEASQDPFEAIAKLDPDMDWQPEATSWSAVASKKLEAGAQLEVCFTDRFSSIFAGVAKAVILVENDLMRHPSGLSRLYIPGPKVSNLRARTFSESSHDPSGKLITTKRRLVDMQISSSIDPTLSIFDIGRLTQGHGSKVREIPTKGSWFSFPLGDVHLALL